MFLRLIFVLIALALVGGAAQSSDVGIAPLDLTQRVNDLIVKGGGEPSFLTLGECKGGLCKFSALHGEIVGNMTAAGADRPVESLSFGIRPGSKLNGMFFATLSAMLEVVAAHVSKPQDRTDAVLSIIRRITSTDSQVTVMVGIYHVRVSVVAQVGIVAQIQ